MPPECLGPLTDLAFLTSAIEIPCTSEIHEYLYVKVFCLFRVCVFIFIVFIFFPYYLCLFWCI